MNEINWKRPIEYYTYTNDWSADKVWVSARIIDENFIGYKGQRTVVIAYMLDGCEVITMSEYDRDDPNIRNIKHKCIRYANVFRSHSSVPVDKVGAFWIAGPYLNQAEASTQSKQYSKFVKTVKMEFEYDDA